MKQTAHQIRMNKKLLIILGIGIFFLLPLVNSLTLDSTIVLNTTASHSAMTFSIDVDVSEVVVEPTYIYLKDVSYVQDGETKTCSSINYSTANSVLDSADFPCDGGGSEIISGGGYPTFYPTEEDLNKGYERLMYKNWKISFKVENDSHLFEVENITNTFAKIKISSKTQEAVLSAGEEEKFELSGDNYYDLLVKLNSIDTTLGNRANFTLQTIQEKIPVSEPPQKQEEQPQIKQKNKWWIWLAVGLGILIIIGLKLYLGKKHKKRK